LNRQVSLTLEYKNIWYNCILRKNIFKDCSVAEAIETVTLHPAQVLGIQQFKGTLNYGADADFVFLGHKLNVQSTWINGQCVFEHNSGAGYIVKKTT